VNLLKQAWGGLGWAVIGAMAAFPFWLKSYRQVACEDLAKAALPIVMAVQDEALREQGIEHTVIPRVVCELPDELQDFPAFLPYDDLFTPYKGIFMPAEKERVPTIHIPPSIYLKLLEHTLVQRLGDWAETAGLGKTHIIEQVLAHELGHSVIYAYLKEYGLPSLPESDNDPTIPNLKVVHEGIAEYFRYRTAAHLGIQNHKESNDEYDLCSGHVSTATFYIGGFLAVKPVIDQFGKHGMMHLLKNPPTDGELEHLNHYQQRILGALRTQKTL
jgi:hypothetical protein